MRMKKMLSAWIGIIFGILALVTVPRAAQATPITYQFTGSGSGSLGATTFSGAAFVVTLRGDTTDVAIFVNLGAIPGNENLTGNIAITGVGTSTFTNSLFIFSAPPEIFTVPLAFYGFGTFSSSGGHGNLISLNTPTGPDLVSNFGPTSSPNSSLSQFHDETTSLGNLTFSTMSDVTFRETVGVVPEPSTMVLIGSGLVAAIRARRRQTAA